MTTQTQLSAFNFENAAIRVITINNEPWFIASDLCQALNISNHRDAIAKLDDDEKGVGLTDTLGGKQELAIVSESGMYTLILRCRDAVKKGSVPHRFRKWVTAEVLPQIRKTGQYSQNSQRNLPLAPPEKMMSFRLTESDLRNIAWLWFAGVKMAELIGEISPALRMLGSNLAGTAHSHNREYGQFINRIGPMIYNLTKDVDFGDRPAPYNALKQAVEPKGKYPAKR